jgi:hypothetical protein
MVNGGRQKAMWLGGVAGQRDRTGCKTTVNHGA